MSEQKKTFSTYKDLEMWQKGVTLAHQVYLLSATFPEEEVFGLTGSVRHTAVEVPCLVARGYTLKFRHPQLYKQNLQQALASLSKLETLLELSVKLAYLEKLDSTVNTLINDEFKMIIGMIKKLNVQLSEPADHQDAPNSATGKKQVVN